MPGERTKTDNNIHTAIAAVMAEVGYVKKERSAGLSYSYAGEVALIQALRPAMLKHGIYVSVVEVKDARGDTYTTARGTQMVSTRIVAVIRFMHVPSETHIDVQTLGEGADPGDKSCNKAMTGAYKYALRQTFCIETGDDPDKNSSTEQEREPFEKHVKKPATLETDEPPPAEEPEATEERRGSMRFGTCRHCGCSLMKETSHSKANPDRKFWKCVNEECRDKQTQDTGRKDGGFRGWCDEAPTDAVPS